MFGLGFFAKPTNSLLVALGLSLLWGGVSAWRITGLKGDLALVKSEYAAVQASLKSKDATIKECVDAGQRLFKAAKAMDAELQEAAKRTARLNDQLVQARADRRVAEEKDRVKPECQIILHSDLSACPGFVDGVRKRDADSIRGSSR